jgi:hypothetical protein
MSDGIDFIKDNPFVVALGLGAPLLAGPAAGALGTAGLTAGEAGTLAAADAMFGAAMIPEIGAVTAGGALPAAMTGMAGFGTQVGPSLLGTGAANAGASGSLSHLAQQNMGLMSDPWAAAAAEISAPGSSYTMPLATDAMNFGMSDALMAASMMGGGQEPMPMPSGGGGGRASAGAANPFMSYAPEGYLSQIEPTAGLLDDVIRMGMIRGYS